MAAPERPSTPLWWYAIVAVALVFAAMWVVGAVVGFLLGIVKLAVLVILAIAFIGWVVGKKSAR
ncbi:MAG TPA: hypothetical protein VGJ03_10750 [Acidimicrobiales bacterium]|jgi:hypothetical protein